MPTYLTPGVYIEEIDTGPKPLAAVGTAVAAFVGFTAHAPTDDPEDPEGLRPRLVSSWAQYERLYGGFAPGALLPHAVYGYFNNGGSLCYIVRIAHTKPADKKATLALGAAGSTGDGGGGGGKAAKAKTALEITALVDEPFDVVVEPGAPPLDDEPQTFDLSIRVGGVVEEHYPSVTMDAGPNNVATMVNDVSTRITVTVADASAMLPELGRHPVTPAAATPVSVSAGDFEGREISRTGIRGLSIAEDVTMIAVPDLVTACRREDGSIDLDMWKSVQAALITHCEGQANRMAILDPPPGLDPQQIKEWRTEVAGYDSEYAALYYPWLKVANPAGTNGDRVLTLPPSAFLAGVWARTDATRGVWKAPANEVVLGALDVATKVSQAEQGLLNPIGINCIRPFGTRGIRVWGARTLSSDQSWQYLNVRRLFNMVETSILEGTQWVVFEPNDEPLWNRVRRTVEGFLTMLWRDGALAGSSPDQAFFVKCDEDLNPPESVETGRLVVEVGIAPTKPAEFVVFRISQMHAGGTVE